MIAAAKICPSDPYPGLVQQCNANPISFARAQPSRPSTDALPKLARDKRSLGRCLDYATRGSILARVILQGLLRWKHFASILLGVLLHGPNLAGQYSAGSFLALQLWAILVYRPTNMSALGNKFVHTLNLRHAYVFLYAKRTVGPCSLVCRA